MSLFKKLLITVAVLLVLYFIGPHPAKPVYSMALPAVPQTAASLEQHIAQEESKHKIKADNEARIVWANDSLKQKTEYAIVYLHGFSASQEEGNPVHRDIAKEFGCNLYLARLSEHGIDTTDQLINLTADNLWESAKEAYAIGKQLGKKVILMGTSTGATLALQLAVAYPEVAGLILLSPNIAINDPNAWLLNDHWGLQIARLVKGSKFNTAANSDTLYKQYWYKYYRLEAAAQLQELLETTMNAVTFSKVKQPVLTLYYYKDEKHQDDVVKVSAIREMFEQLGTLSSQKKLVAIPGAGGHVLGSSVVSKDIPSVEKETGDFLKEIMMLKSQQ